MSVLAYLVTVAALAFIAAHLVAVLRSAQRIEAILDDLLFDQRADRERQAIKTQWITDAAQREHAHLN